MMIPEQGVQRGFDMIINKDRLNVVVDAYLSGPNTKWNLANQVLYDLCSVHPKHINADEIVAKIWLIGRSYAAAIERRKNAKDFVGDFYYDEVAPRIIAISDKLDDKIGDLIAYSRISAETLDSTFSLHGFLMGVFHELTGMDKRSLASKYLHFHCPNMFFIYDSRASKAIRRFVRKSKGALEGHILYDMEYADFCIRALELRDYLNSEYHLELTPRELDNLLLYYSNK